MNTRSLSLGTALLALSLSGCAGTEWVKTIDEDGTVHYEAMNEEDRALHAQEQDVEAQRIERAAAAPKRDAGDPISVAVYPMDLRDGLAENTKGRMWKAFRKHFDNDPVVRPVRQKDVDSQLERAKNWRMHEIDIACDVTVKSVARLDKAVGVTSSGKLASATVIVFEATISDSYGGEVYEVEHKSSLFKNEEGLELFYRKIHAAITQKVGPTIPADSWKYRKGVDLEAVEQSGAVGEWLNKLQGS